MRLRDTQRSKLYAWETELFDVKAEINQSATGAAEIVKITTPPMMEIKEIKKLVTKVARDYGLSHRKVAVGDGRGRRRACYSPSTREIKLPRWARKQWVVLHELAHWIEYVLHPKRAAWHGREFTGIYMELLRRYDGRDMQEMRTSANRMRVDFMPNSECTARYLKKHGLR